MKRKKLSRLLAITMAISMTLGGNFPSAVEGIVSYGAEFSDGGEAANETEEAAALSDEETSGEPEEIISAEETADGNEEAASDGEEQQFQDVTEPSDAMPEEAVSDVDEEEADSEDQDFEEVEEDNAPEDLLDEENLQPVYDESQIIEDPANPACGMIVDFTLDNLDTYSDMKLSYSTSSDAAIYYQGIRYYSSYEYFLYGERNNRFTYIRGSRDSILSLAMEARKAGYGSIQAVILPRYYSWDAAGKRIYLTDSILAQKSSLWADSFTIKLEKDYIISYEMQQTSDKGGKGVSIPKQEQWITYEGDEEPVIEQLTAENSRSVIRIQRAVSKQILEYQDNGLPKGSVIIRNTGSVGTDVAFTGHWTGNNKYITGSQANSVIEEGPGSDERYLYICYEKYFQNEEGKWEKLDHSREFFNLRSETTCYISPGENLVLYPNVSELYHYRILAEINRYSEYTPENTMESIDIVQGEWKQEGQYWSTEVSSDAAGTINPLIDIKMKKAVVPSYKENGLPNYALLIHGDAQAEAVTDYTGKSRYPGYFVRVNPCWDKQHNSQPEKYQTPGLWVACLYYKWDQDAGKYKLNDKKGVRNIENYEDTSDYYHCFYVEPQPDEVAAIVPLRCVGDRYYTGYESEVSAERLYEKAQSRNYCFQYQVFLNSTQEWKISGVEALDGQSSPKLVDGMVKGAWLTCGNGADEHEGTVGTDLAISTQLQTGGVLLEHEENGLPNVGVRLKVGDFPEDGLSGLLKINLTVPEVFKNGEAGMGFATDDEYRQGNKYDIYWTYKITGKGGTKATAILYRDTDGNGTYKAIAAKQASVTAEDGGCLNLAGMDIHTGDVLCIIPYSPEYTGKDIYASEGKYTSSKVSWFDHSIHASQYDECYGSTQLLRYFNFDYSISMDGTGNLLSVTGDNGTEIVDEDGTFYGNEPVCDDGRYLQEAVLAVSTGAETEGCGRLENGLPNYGFVFPSEVVNNGYIYIEPDLNKSEKYSWYALEKYQMNKDGKYVLVSNNYGSDVEIYKVSKEGFRIWIYNSSGSVWVLRPIIPTDAVIQSMKSNYTSIRWNYNKADGPYEQTDQAGNVIYPQTGTGSYSYLVNDVDRSGKKEITYYTYLKKTNRWTTTDWENTSPEVIYTSNASCGVTGKFDYGSKDSRVVVLQGLELGSLSLAEQTLPDHGLPENGLVIQNKNIGGSFSELADFNVRLDMPRTGACGRDCGVMFFGAWLYKQDAEGNWYKADKMNDTSDWINFSIEGDHSVGQLYASYGYTVHAQLKDNEAIVIVPQYDLYTFSYRIWLSNTREYDVVSGSCQIPSDVQHPSRHEFTGTLSHFPTENPKTEQLVIATSPKNIDAGGSETVSRLTNVRSLPVTLFDYDFGEWAHFVLGAQTAQYRFRYDPKNVKNTAVNTWYSNVFPGILKDQLGEDGLPVFNYTTPFSLFDASAVPSAINGGTKSVYQNVGFDFVYDPSANEYSYQSSINHAGYDAETNKIYQYDKAIGIEGWDEKGAGFFPFNSFEDEGVWGTAQKNTQGIYLLDQLKTVDYHFGMSMEKDFIIPEDGTVVITDDQGNATARKDMVFSFSGDDDAWLFVDGKLVLDMGGIHEAVSGSINFTKGTYTVTSSVTGDTKTQALASVFTDYPEVIGKWDDSAWAAGTKHTFSFFYLERGGTLSDCSIKFNLPVFKQFAVTKAVEGKDTQEGFDFEMELQDGQGNAYTGNLYQLVDGKRTPVENGAGKYKFQLKAGETIQFSTQQECIAYRVTETTQENWITGWNSTDGRSGEGNVTEFIPTDCDVTVTNRYQEPTPTPKATDTPAPQISATPAPQASNTPVPSGTVSITPAPTKKVEPSNTPEPSGTVTVTNEPSGGTGNGGSGGTGYNTTSPRTGDASDADLWQVMLFGAMGVTLIIAMRLVRKRKEM